MTLEPGYWNGVRQQQLGRNLAQAVAQAHQYDQRPEWLRRHFNSFMALLRSACFRQDLQPLCTELVLALHPWPVRWGLWAEWLAALRLAARTAAGQPGQQAEVLGHLAQLAFDSGRLDEAYETASQAIEQAFRIGHASALSVAGAALVVTLIARGEMNTARQAMRKMEAGLEAWDATTSPDVLQLAQARLALQKTVLLRRDGDLPEAIRVADQVVSMLKRLVPPTDSLLPLAYQMRATLHWAQGSYLLSVDDLQQAITLFARQGDPVAEVASRGNLGLVYWSMAELDLAETSILASLAQCERINAYSELIRQVGNIVAVCFSRGQLSRGLQYVERQLQLACLSGDEEEASRARGNRGGLLLYLGDYPAALADLQESLAHYEAQSRQEATLGTFVDLSVLYAHWGKAETGLPYARQALEAARRLKIPVLEVIALRALAECQPLAQREPFLRQALELSIVHHRRLDQAGCWLSLSVAAASPAERAAAWQKGSRLLKEMGAATWLEGHSSSNPPCVALLI